MQDLLIHKPLQGQEDGGPAIGKENAPVDKNDSGGANSSKRHTVLIHQLILTEMMMITEGVMKMENYHKKILKYLTEGTMIHLEQTQHRMERMETPILEHSSLVQTKLHAVQGSPHRRIHLRGACASNVFRLMMVNVIVVEPRQSIFYFP